VELSVASARGTQFQSFGGELKEGIVRGRVVVDATGAGAPGMVLLTFHGPNETIANTIRVALDAQGYFTLRGFGDAVQKLKAKRLSAHYPGVAGYAPCDAPSSLSM
jgi:hypothetical protein